jgi:hypothetical protein
VSGLAASVLAGHSWHAAADGRAHLLVEGGEGESLSTACDRDLVALAVAPGVAPVCLGCLAAVLGTEPDAPMVPRRTPRCSRRCLHTKHRWLVTRCRRAGGAR